jgi:hypothetical protein
MTVDEAWTQLRTRLVELVGMSGAEILMDRPHGGWGDLVTNHTLDLRFAAWEERFAASEQRFDHKLDALEARMELRFAAVDAQFAEILSGVGVGFAAVNHQFDLLRAEMRAQGADLRAEMYRRSRSQTLVMVSTFTALASVIVAAIRL